MKKINWLDIFMGGFKLNFLQSSWNFERLQNTGFLFSIYLILKKIYKNNIELLKKAIERHIDFFNTNIFFASAVFGMIVRLEEELDNSDAHKKHTEIESAKIGVMGPLAAIGDSIFWSTIKPFALLIGCGFTYLMGFTPESFFYGFGLSVIIFNLPRIIIKYYLLIKSYYDYNNLFLLLQKIKFQYIVKVIKIAALFLLGAIMAGFFYQKNLNLIPVRLFDNVLLIVIFIFITIALKKKTVISHIIIAIVIFSILLSYLIT